MDIETLREYCLSKPSAEESFPFGPETIVFKVKGKLFALAPIDPPYSINLKCEPGLAIELREKYSAVSPGYHMNKVHWNTIMLDGSIPNGDIKTWIDHSYSLIVNSLSKKLQSELG